MTIPNPLGLPRDTAEVYPGKYEHPGGTIPYNLAGGTSFPKGKTLWVINTADRPIQVGSHYHLDDVNKHKVDASGNVLRKGLDFYENVKDGSGNDQQSSQRADVRGYRLHIAAGTSERFEPGADAARRVWVVPIEGDLDVWGLQAGKDATEARVPRR
ncbi:urease subunit beta [Streptomyces smyrnaeus]